jgi:hypothetical protein
MVGAAWATGTVALGWMAGDIQLAVLIATLSFMLLVLFMGLWGASSLLGAALTFGATGGLIAVGALVFALWSRWVGGALMIGAGVALPVVGLWASRRWGRDGPLAEVALDEDEHALPAWGRGKAFLDLPKYPTNEPIWLGWEFGAINPNAGRRDD